MKINKNWILISLFNFLVAALMGLILRGAFVWGSSWFDYRNLMHGHSHVAMLGWVYLALYVLIVIKFIPQETRKKPVYSYLFWFTQFTVLGMMVSFPIQGYGAISILFSALHILASYVFTFLVWRDHRVVHPEVGLMLKTALVLMVVSTVGVWSLGPMTIFGGRSSTLYQLAIQFYLHFQFHGWFTFCILSLLISAVSDNFDLNRSIFRRFYTLLLFSAILTYGLVLAWGLGGLIPLVVNAVGLLFQLAALLLFFKLMSNSNRNYFKNLNPLTKALYQFGLLSWIIKVVIQTVVLLPSAAMVSFTIRSLMIGFIHLTLLGFISGVLFALIFSYYQEIIDKRAVKTGSVAFIAGFALSELLLFSQGLLYWIQWGQLPAYYEVLFGVSVLLPLGILLIVLNIIQYSRNPKPSNHVMIL